MNYSKFSFLIILFSFLAYNGFSQQIEPLPDSLKIQLKTRVDDRIKEFLVLIEIIGDKSSAGWKKDLAMEEATSFFLDKGSYIQVSSLNRNGNREFTPADYFAHLRNLKYDQVKLNLEHLSTENIETGAGNTYRTWGHYGQVFSGYSQGKLVYEDYTIKLITIIIYEVGRTNDFDIKFKSIEIVKTLR